MKSLIELNFTASARRASVLALVLGLLMLPSTLMGQTDVSRVDERLANSADAQVERLLAEMTLEEKVSLCHANSKFTIAGVARLGIAEMCMSDGPHGVREEISRDSWKSAGWTNDFSTYLPPLTGVAASFDPEMAKLHGSVLGAEARERNKDVILGPGCNLARNPLYGRNFEYLGEDPYLASVLIVPEIKAIQANDVAACAKHYALNTQELNRHGVNAQPSERTLREIYLPAFEAAVKEANVLTIMGAYNEFRGTNCNQSKHLIMDILKGEWGFTGLVMTDWDCDINSRDAAINSLDIEMGTRKPSYDQYFLANPFLKMLKSGDVLLAVLDDKVRRILRVQIAIGMMDENRMPGSRGSKQHQEKARRIIENGIVLLKNESDRLPLNRDQLKTILVMGPNADVAHGRGGGSSQVKTPFEITPLDGLKKKLGDDVKVIHLKAAPPASAGLPPIGADFIATRHPGAGTPACKILVYDDTKREKQSSIFWSPSARLRFDDGEMHHQRLVANLVPLRDGKHLFRVEADGVVELRVNGKKMLSSSQATLGEELEAEVELKKGRSYKVQLNYDGNQGYTLGWNAPGNPYVDETVYLKAANEADAVIYFGGLNHSYDREADDRANMKLPGNQDYVIPKLLEANPNTVVWMVAGSAVEMPWVNQVDSVLWGWYGGMFTGQAYADVLLGDVVPSGKMPFTLPRKLADNPHVHLKDYDAENCFYREGVMMGYRWFDEKEIMPMFPFGHGLSYSTFEFSDLEVSSKQFDPGDKLTVTFTIKNTGSVAAAEVGQVYVEDMASSVARPRKELKGFKKVWLKSGESKSVDVELNHRSFAFWDESTNSWKVEPGKFQIHVGDSVSGIKLRGVITAK